MATIADKEYQRLITTQRKYKNYCTVIRYDKKGLILLLLLEILLQLSTGNNTTSVLYAHKESYILI